MRTAAVTAATLAASSVPPSRAHAKASGRHAHGVVAFAREQQLAQLVVLDRAIRIRHVIVLLVRSRDAATAAATTAATAVARAVGAGREAGPAPAQRSVHRRL